MKRLFFLSLLCVLAINTMTNTMEQSDSEQKALCKILGISENSSADEFHNATRKFIKSLTHNEPEAIEKSIKFNNFLESTLQESCSLCSNTIPDKTFLTLNKPFTGKTPCCDSSINLCYNCTIISAGNNIKCPNSTCCASLDVIRNFNGITLNKIDKCSVCFNKMPDKTYITFNQPFTGKTPCCDSPINWCYNCKNSVNKNIRCPNSSCCESLNVIRNFNGITLNKVKK